MRLDAIKMVRSSFPELPMPSLWTYVMFLEYVFTMFQGSFSACVVYTVYMGSDLRQVTERGSVCVFSSTLVFEEGFC